MKYVKCVRRGSVIVSATVSAGFRQSKTQHTRKVKVNTTAVTSSAVRRGHDFVSVQSCFKIVQRRCSESVCFQNLYCGNSLKPNRCNILVLPVYRRLFFVLMTHTGIHFNPWPKHCCTSMPTTKEMTNRYYKSLGSYFKRKWNIKP